jgi:hypothetical protein
MCWPTRRAIALGARTRREGSASPAWISVAPESVKVSPSFQTGLLLDERRSITLTQPETEPYARSRQGARHPGHRGIWLGVGFAKRQVVLILPACSRFSQLAGQQGARFQRGPIAPDLRSRDVGTAVNNFTHVEYLPKQNPSVSLREPETDRPNCWACRLTFKKGHGDG